MTKNSTALAALAKLPPARANGKAKNGHANTDDVADIAARQKSVEEQMKAEKSGILPFPEHVFPEMLQGLMKAFYKSSGLPFEYYYAALLAATAILLGNRYRIKAKSDFIQPQLLYLAIVGKSGLGKSPPIKAIFGALFRIEAQLAETYQEAHRLWSQEKQEALADKTPYNVPEPLPQKLIIGQATIEALYEILSNNPLGVGMVDEELTGFMEGMGQYKSGKSNELQYWLKLFDNPEFDSISRKGNKELQIKCGNVTIFGGVQPELLNLIAAGKLSAIGLSSRFQFVVPEKAEIPAWNESQPDVTVFTKYQQFMEFMHSLPSKISRKDMSANYNQWNIERIDMPLSVPAKSLYVEFYESLRTRMNEEEDDKKFSQLSKLRSYCLRYALNLEMLNFCCEAFESRDWEQRSKNDQLAILGRHEIGFTAMQGAIQLIEYFISTSMTVLARFDNVLNTYPKNIRVWYKNLPDAFRASFAVEVGSSAGLSRSTVYNHLNDPVLFKKDAGSGLVMKKIVTE